VNDGKHIDKDNGWRPLEKEKEKPASYFAKQQQKKLADDGTDATDVASSVSSLNNSEHEVDSSQHNQQAVSHALRNGQCFRARLVHLQLREPPLPTEFQKIHDCITASLRAFSKEAIRPTVCNLQQKCREQGLQEQILQILLVLCAHKQDTYEIWLPADAQVCITLINEPPNALLIESDDFHVGYEPELLQVLEETITNRANHTMTTSAAQIAGVGQHSATSRPYKPPPGLTLLETVPSPEAGANTPQRRMVKASIRMMAGDP